jgi:hypothetical protein
MGFTKEEAVNKITAEFAKEVKDINLWQRTIQENVDNLYSFVEGKEDYLVEDFVNKVLPLLRTTQGFMRKTNADIAKEKEQEIRTIQDELQKLKGGKTSESTPTEDDKYKKLEEGYNKLMAMFNAQEEAKQLSQQKESLISKVVEKGVKNKEWVQAMVDKMYLNAEMDIEKETADLVAMYNKFMATTPTDITPAGGGANEKSPFSKIIEEAGKSLENREY